MMASPTNVYLETCLEPLAAHLARPDVTDIWINRPGELWLEVLGGNKALTAQILGVDRRTLYRKLERYDLESGNPPK